MQLRMVSYHEKDVGRNIFSTLQFSACPMTVVQNYSLSCYLSYMAAVSALIYAFPEIFSPVIRTMLFPVLTRISFQSHSLLFSHVSAELRGENTPERNFASTGSRTHNHQVMSPTRSPLSHTGRGRAIRTHHSTSWGLLAV